MRVPIHIAVAVSVALMSIGYAQASKKIHKSHKAYVSSAIHSTPGYEHYWGDGAAYGNNANSMRGSNSAVENANGRTNCC
jgi:hypothetical protein